MDLNRALQITQDTMLDSPDFPYRTGQLKNNFIDKGILTLSPKSIGFSVLGTDFVYYGKILEVAPSINYKTKTGHIRHKNIHYQYIERIIDGDVVPAIEEGLGVRLI